MALYHQLKFPSTFIEYRSVSEWKGVVVISNFDSFLSRPFKSTALGSCLVCLGLNTPLNNIYIYIHKQIKFSSISCSHPVLAVCKIRLFLTVRQSYIAVFVQWTVLSFCWNVTVLPAN